MSIAALIRRMRELGAPIEAIEIAVEAIEAEQSKDAERRAKRAAQKAKERARTKGEQSSDCRATVARQGDDNEATAPSLKDALPSSETVECNQNPPPYNPPAPGWPQNAMGEFWAVYPRRVAKRDAEKALERIRKGSKVPFSRIMDGLRAYLATNPDPQFIPYPASWLNGGRWDDEQPPPQPRQAARGSPHAEPARSVQSASIDLVRKIQEAYDEPQPEPTRQVLAYLRG